VTDDMLIVRGVNVFPSEIERVLLGISELAPHYQVVLERNGTLDEVAVEAEANGEFEERLGGALLVDGIEGWEVHDEVKRLNHKVATALHEAMGIHFDVRLFVPGTLPRSEGKAVRVVDRRQ